MVPDYLDLTVGGTLAVGVGSRTARSGVAADNLLELAVVTGRGEQVSCSPVRNQRLFDAVRAGLAGGALYPVSAFPMSRADWRDHFGPAFGPLSEVKDGHDPGRVLTPGYEVF